MTAEEQKAVKKAEAEADERHAAREAETKRITAERDAEARRLAEAAAPPPITTGDLVKVKLAYLPVGSPAEVLKVEELHYLRLPALDEINRTVVCKCLRPNPEAKGSDKYDDPNRFENWPAKQLDKVGESKPARAAAPAEGGPTDYDAMTVEDLHAEATERNIDGRSAMDKAALVKALQKDDKAKTRGK